jgi:hypothetical protein
MFLEYYELKNKNVIQKVILIRLSENNYKTTIISIY